MRPILFTLVLLAMSAIAKASDYQAGELWSYKTRPGDDESLVLIDRVETVPKLGTIYHISVLRVHLPNPKDESRRLVDLPHFPVSKQTLDLSVIELVGKRAPLDAYLPGYAEWKRAFDAGEAGVFTIAVSDIVGMIETAIARKKL